MLHQEKRSEWIGRGLAALRVAVIAAAGASVSTAYAAESVDCWWNIAPNEDLCMITEPNVTRASTDYPGVPIRAWDQVTIWAGGCVQTGGSGATWKRYVDPQGSNSDRLYHGLIWIPGGTWGLERISNVVNQTITVVPWFGSATLPSYLRLGYEDDNYGGNGYWGHDNGTNNQCLNVYSAWVEVVIQHNCAPGLTRCGTQCVDATSNSANCGACGVVCGGGQLCQSSSCTCPAGTTLCGGRCVSLASDSANCGACNLSCATGQVCQSAACTCAPGYTSCNGQCIDTLNDPAHCGNCARVCSSGQMCSDGVCQ